MLGLGGGTSRGTTRKAVSDDPAPARSWLPVAGGAIWVTPRAGRSRCRTALLPTAGAIAVLSAGPLARRPASRK
jgi:hypothetical protein